MYKNNKLAVITIHKGDIRDLIMTIKSINKQSIFPDLHLVMINHRSFNPSINLKRNKRQIIISKDSSLYNAMNLALKKTFNYNVIFINSGDELSGYKSIKKIKSKLSINKCLIFKTKIIHKKVTFYPKESFFLSDKYMPHPSFVRPPIRNKKEIILLNEKLKIAADGDWMRENIKIFGKRKIPYFTSKFYTGGFSTNPSIASVKIQLNYKITEGLKEGIKFILSKIFKEKYYKIIFRNNFYTR